MLADDAGAAARAEEGGGWRGCGAQGKVATMLG